MTAVTNSVVLSTSAAVWLRDAVLRNRVPTIRQLTDDRRFFPYRYGQALWAYIAGRWGDRAVTELFRFATRAGWETALERFADRLGRAFRDGKGGVLVPAA